MFIFFLHEGHIHWILDCYGHMRRKYPISESDGNPRCSWAWSLREIQAVIWETKKLPEINKKQMHLGYRVFLTPSRNSPHSVWMQTQRMNNKSISELLGSKKIWRNLKFMLFREGRQSEKGHTFVAIWMELKIIILSQARKRKTNTIRHH